MPAKWKRRWGKLREVEGRPEKWDWRNKPLTSPQCVREYHPNKTCEEFEDELRAQNLLQDQQLLQEWIKTNQAKPCPKCKVKPEFESVIPCWGKIRSLQVWKTLYKWGRKWPMKSSIVIQFAPPPLSPFLPPFLSSSSLSQKKGSTSTKTHTHTHKFSPSFATHAYTHIMW